MVVDDTNGRGRVGIVCVLAMFFSVFLSQPATAQNTFSATGSMFYARLYFTLTHLPSGKVLAVGGDTGGVATNSAELYDPATGAWSLTGNMTTPRMAHTATLLQNGKVLVAGGPGSSTGVELYDPSTGQWSPTGALVHARYHHTATLLANGEVLLAGGAGDGGGSAELYDPVTQTWSATGSMLFARYAHSDVLLADGRVLVVGSSSAAEIYDPISRTWSATGPMSIARGGPGGMTTLTRLLDGRVLAVGGSGDASAEVYDPATGTWTPTSSMPGLPRLNPTATLLLDGTVLVTGGAYVSEFSTALIYDPSTQAWAATANTMSTARNSHQAARLFDGRVLVTGGASHVPPVTGYLALADLFTGGNVLKSTLALNVTGPAILGVSGGTYVPNPFDLVATVANTGVATAKDVQLTLSLPGGLTLAKGAQTQAIGDLPAGQQRVVTWSVLAAGRTQDTTVTYLVGISASNAAGGTLGRQIILPGGALTLASITSNVGGDTGSLTATLHGGGFLNGATVKLVRRSQPDILGTNVSVAGDGFSLSVTFDLKGKERGLWDVVMERLDGISAILAGGFTVEEGRASQVWVDIFGPETIRLGRAGTYYLLYGNLGNVDSEPVAIGLVSPWDVMTSFQNAETVSTLEENEEGDRGIFVEVPVVPPGRTTTLAASVTARNLFTLTARRTILPLPDRSRSFDPELDFRNRLRLRLLGFEFDPDLPCNGYWIFLSRCSDFDMLTDYAIDSLERIRRLCPECELVLTAANDLDSHALTGCHPQGAAVDLRFTDSLSAWIENHKSDASWTFTKTLGKGWDLWTWTWEKSSTVFLKEPNHWHLNFYSPNGTCGPRDKRATSHVAGSADPNGKVGAAGLGQFGYVPETEPLRYAIFFENLDTATAPAQEVVITDRLDPASVDLTTFSLGLITFGGRSVNPPPGLSHYTTDVDLRPANNLIVRINASLDKGTGLATWLFISLDPVTGLPTADPLAGFLPPNVTPPQGQGGVLFTVMPKSGLTTGTQIRNKARIEFDVNAPIDTPEWLNTIDNTSPTSRMLPLAATQTTPTFQISWSGTDAGSGVASYTIFVSQNGGPFTPILNDTSNTTAMFTGQDGRTYGFVSFARDQVGNVESKPVVGEVTTRVVLDSTPPTTTASAVPAPNRNGWNATDVVVALTATDNAGGSGVKEINFTISGAQTGGGVVASSSTSVTIVSEGSSTLTYFGKDNAGNQESPKTLTVQIDKTSPTVTCSMSPNTLWPPNNKLVTATASVGVSDALSGSSGFALRSITSNEALVAGDVQGFAVGTSTTVGQLKATRSGSGSGRVYTLTYQGFDGAGNAALCSTTVTVPHDQGK